MEARSSRRVQGRGDRIAPWRSARRTLPPRELRRLSPPAVGALELGESFVGPAREIFLVVVVAAPAAPPPGPLLTSMRRSISALQ
jgi:hypothetical protein